MSFVSCLEVFEINPFLLRVFRCGTNGDIELSGSQL